MKDYEPQMSFDESSADVYDELALRGDEEAAVAFLAELARGGPALELAIGTGRIALPLQATGIRVDGIDFSPYMVGKLRAKPGGDLLSVVVGDMVDLDMPDTYSLIYVVFNSFFNILSQDDQVRCFERVAAHLTDDGVFVVEAGTPAFLYTLSGDQYVEAEGIEVDAVRLDVLRNDPATQVLEENHVLLTKDGIRFSPVMQRYAWPAELDLMARMAGLRLLERWGGFDRRRYTGHSNCVSVWGRP